MVVQGRFEAGCPVIEIPITGLSQPCTVILDTGFNGFLMLSASIINELGWRYLGTIACDTASGISPMDVYEGHLQWMGRDRRVDVLSNSHGACLVGMELLHQCKIEIQRSTNKVSVRA